MKIAYRPGHSFFHQVDPLTKFSWALLTTFWLITMRDLTTVVVVSVLLILMSLLGAHISLLDYLRTVLLLVSGGVFLVIFQGLTREGDGISFGGVKVSYVGLELGLALALRSLGFVASSLAFSRTTRPQDAVLSLIRLGMPYRLAHIAYLSLRFLPLFERDYEALTDAQKMRGIKSSLKQKQKSLIALIGTEARRVEETAIALETRAFGLYPDRTQLESVAISTRGVILLVATLAMIVVDAFWSP